MRQLIDESLKAATIWLTNEDQQSESVMASVTALTQEWRSKGYQPVIFRSGRGDLYENTAALLLHNREGAAMRAAAREAASPAGGCTASAAVILLPELKI